MQVVAAHVTKLICFTHPCIGGHVSKVVRAAEGVDRRSLRVGENLQVPQQ